MKQQTSSDREVLNDSTSALIICWCYRQPRTSPTRGLNSAGHCVENGERKFKLFCAVAVPARSKAVQASIEM
ncbi:MAG: hypothetical protein IPP33_13120 [Flavobacteriales bacterium]|nr:hypothetical protein [Flavobacteriales bacterium]